jgi:3-hydroxybutyryl-CoA dehydrogenase
MSGSSALIVGKNRLALELAELCREKGVAAELCPDATRAAAPAALALETTPGGIEEKRAAIRHLDSRLEPECVILTSCLGFSATEIASWTARPERIVGFATFYPLRERKLIELCLGLRSADDALERAEGFFERLGKATVRVADSPGLVFPRIVSLIINEAARSLSEGVAGAEEIDLAMRLGVNYPQGPLRWADQIGLDEVLAVLEGLERETGDDRYRPAPLLKRMVRAGWLGEQSERGFYPSR